MGSKGRAVPEKPRILWISDAVAHTGFATVTHGILKYLHKKYDVHILAVNYLGDPHDYPYKIYPAYIGGDVLGIGRTKELLGKVKPHLTFMIADPWVVKDYLSQLDGELGKLEDGTPVRTHRVAYMPVDAKNIQPQFAEPLNELDHAICYTQFAEHELRTAGMTKPPVTIISHGFDRQDFFYMPKSEARKRLRLDPSWYIVGCVNRNQPRKRIDLAIQYFAEWAKDKPKTVKFYYHGALRDTGWNVVQLAEYYGVDDRLIITSPSMTTATGVPRDVLRCVYNSFDVQVTTTLGEGWGLTQMEGMACKVPQIVPEWSGLAEWAAGGVQYVRCSAEMANSNGLNTIGGVADKIEFIDILESFYTTPKLRDQFGTAGYDLVRQDRFNWQTIANQFDSVFTQTMGLA